MTEAIKPSTPRTRRSEQRAHGRLRPAHSERVRVCGLAQSTPATSFTQEDVLRLLGLATDPFAVGVFSRSGVRNRQLDLSRELLAGTLQERTAATEEGLFKLAVEAIDRLAIDPAEIGVVVSATYYSLGGPTLAHRVVDHYGLNPATDKYHLTGIGCAGAVPLFRLACDSLRGRPGRRALVVAAESASGFHTGVRPGDERVKVVGSALFGDGCAAALLAADGEGAGGPTIVGSAVHQVPGTLDQVRFAVTREDSHLQISRELPTLAGRAVKPLVETFVRGHGLTTADIEHWLLHPGGRGIIETLQRGLGLADEQVAASVRVLADHGNVGTAASLFVLGATLADPGPASGDHALMITIGPGVTVGLMLLEWSPDSAVNPGR